MNEIARVLDVAVRNEPTMSQAVSLDPANVLTAGRRARRRRRAVVAASALGVGVGCAALTVALVPGADGTPHSIAAAPTPPSQSAPVYSTSATPAPARGITRESLPGQVERAAGIRLSSVDVSVLPPLNDIDLGAAISSAKKQYLNVQVTPAGAESVTRPRCADLEGNGTNGDLYSGACEVRPTSDGGYLVLRTGRTADGKYAKTQADLTTGDGAGVFAEASNQIFTAAGRGIEPVVSRNPPLTSRQLERLVLALASQR